MAAKKNFPLIFLIAATAGFALLWMIEAVLEAQLHSGAYNSWGYFGTFLHTKIRALGTEAAINLLPTLKFRWIFLCLLAMWLAGSASDSEAPDESRLRWRVRLFFVVQLLFIPELLAELNIRWRWAGFFEPPLLSGLILGEMPPLMLLQFAGLLLFGLSAWLVLAKWENGSLAPALLSLTIWLIWTFLLSIYQSGGVIDHAYASLHSAMFFMAAFLFIWWKFPELAGLGHRLFQAGIWGCYFFAAAEKLFLSGIDWLNPENFSILCMHHPGEFCSWFASHTIPAGMVLAAVMVFELLSPLQWKYPRWGYFTMACGIVFHLGTWLVLDVGGWQSPWILMLLFLLPVQGTKTIPAASGKAS